MEGKKKKKQGNIGLNKWLKIKKIRNVSTEEKDKKRLKSKNKEAKKKRNGKRKKEH